MNAQERKDAIKQIIRDIHAGADPEMLKQKFKDALGDISPMDIGRAEQELVQEGMPREEVRRLCDVHLAVMRDALGKDEGNVHPGHPIYTFKEEHKRILEFTETLQETANDLKKNPSPVAIAEKAPLLKHVTDHLLEAEKHNAREENVLFPYLEKHGITEPPAVMWSEHNDLRGLKKKLKELISALDRMKPNEFTNALSNLSRELHQTFSSHIFKEDNILYPMALKVVSSHEWPEIRRQCDELGYCCFTPETATAPKEAPQEAASAPATPEGEQRAEKAAAPKATEAEEKLSFPTGTLSREELEWILNTLPIDITFVDKDDVFRYFSGTKDRIFARTRASLGRKVQQCHPQKSLPIVNQILDDFRSGRKDSEHFWIRLNDVYAYISYFAVRNDKGEYLGTVETIQDIAPLQKITGEKRLP